MKTLRLKRTAGCVAKHFSISVANTAKSGFLIVDGPISAIIKNMFGMGILVFLKNIDGNGCSFDKLIILPNLLPVLPKN